MNSCNLRNQNVHIVNSISQHSKRLNVGKSGCSSNVSEPVICNSSNKSACYIVNASVR